MSYTDLFSELKKPARYSPTERLEQRRQALVRAGLTAQQVQAVSAPAVPCIVVNAGAGSGKTRTLAERIVWLLESGVRAEDILVSTFTRAAAGELLERTGKRLGVGQVLSWCGTTHALALRLLGGPAALAAAGVRLLGEEDYLLEADWLKEQASGKLASMSAQELLTAVQRRIEERSGVATGLDALGLLAQAWLERLQTHGSWDFSMLLRATLAAPAQQQFRHLLVDEAQDLSALQLAWLRHHSAPGACLYLVGDENQSLYGFRGSQAGMLAQHVQAGALHLGIDENFRCARRILAHANNVIAFNPQQLGTPLRAARELEGTVDVRHFETAEAEALAAAAALANERSHAVLVRTREMLAPFLALGLNARTLHEAKGLEWDTVWMAGLEQGVLPHVLGEREEERRLCYVGMTRARNALTLSYVSERRLAERTLHPAPSLFLYEAQALDART